MFTAAILATVHAFEGSSRQGTAIGLVSSGFGLSAAIWVSLYREVFRLALQPFFAFFGLVYGATVLANLFFVYVPPPAMARRRPQTQTDKIKFIEARAVEGEADAPEEASVAGEASCKGVLRICRSMLRTPELVHYVFCFSLLQGAASGVVLGNVSLLARSVGASEPQAQMLVPLFSVANCAGRIGVGIAMDAWQFAPKPWFTLLAGIGISGTCALLAALGDSAPAELVCAIIIIPGLGYGANWAIMPVYMAELFGSHKGGVGFALAASCVAPVSAIFALATGSLYDAQAGNDSISPRRMAALTGACNAENGAHAKVCTGAACFRVALLIASVVALLAVAVAAALVRRGDTKRPLNPHEVTVEKQAAGHCIAHANGRI